MCSSMWETPILSALSWSEAARIHAPKATDRTPGMYSESTVSPFGRTVRRKSDAADGATRVTRASVLRHRVHHESDAGDRRGPKIRALRLLLRPRPGLQRQLPPLPER